ncbi:unnamed protein product [Ascophyllum nodosum]
MSGASHSPPDSSLDEASEEGFILASINTLLNRVGISAKPINSFEELRKSASSMFVAIFEAMFQVRQRGVVRKPAHVHNYVHNAQMVVDALAGPILNMDLSHITGEAIVRGDTVAIRNLVDIFMGINEVVTKRQGRPQGTPPASDFRSESHRHQGVEHGQQLHQGQEPMLYQLSSRPLTSPRSRSSHLSQPQPATRMAGRGRGRGISRGIARGSGPRAGDREGRVRPAMLGAVGHRGLDKRKEERVVGDGYIDESMDRNELSPFLTELESSSSPPGEGLTAQDILKAQRMYEGDGNFGVGINAAPEPLRHVGLEMQRHAHRQEEEREMKYRRYYQSVLKDRLTELRKRELADARKQSFAHKNAIHLARVRKIKKDRFEEKLRLARLSQRFRFRDEGRRRLTHLYKKILTALHRQRKEDDREDAARLKALHLAWQAQSDDLEKFFNERVELIVGHEKSSSRERAQAIASAEKELSDLFHHAERDYEARLMSQLELQAVGMAAEERHHAEVQHAYKELLQMEDWSGASRDRFLGVRPNTAFEQRLKQVRGKADKTRARLNKEKKMRELAKAYGKAS